MEIFVVVMDSFMTGGGAKPIAAYSSREAAEAAIAKLKSSLTGGTTLSMSSYNPVPVPLDQEIDINRLR